MVEKDYQPYINLYDVNVEEKRKLSPDGSISSDFVTISDNKQPLPPVVLHYVSGEIYSLDFANNSFFEVPNDTLLRLLGAILAGEYEIKTSLLRRRKSIRVNLGNERIWPERVYDAAQDEYANLPCSFTHKEGTIRPGH